MHSFECIRKSENVRIAGRDFHVSAFRKYPENSVVFDIRPRRTGSVSKSFIYEAETNLVVLYEMTNKPGYSRSRNVSGMTIPEIIDVAVGFFEY